MALTRKQLEIIYRDLEAPLFNFALRWVFNPALAEEVVQDAFVRIWSKAQQVELETLKGLLYKTVQNLSLNEIRKRRLRDAIWILDWFKQEGEAGSSAMQSLIDQEELAAMRVCLEKLPFEWREVLLLSQFSDMTYTEISLTLGIPEGTVASRKNRALQFMRENLSSLEGKENG